MIEDLLLSFMVSVPIGAFWRSSKIMFVAWGFALVGFAVGTMEITRGPTILDLIGFAVSVVGFLVGCFSEEIEAYLTGKE